MPKNGRPPVSCAECRRSKLRCDRVWPCGECVRRGCPEICPDGILTGRRTMRNVMQENTELKNRIAQTSFMPSLSDSRENPPDLEILPIPLSQSQISPQNTFINVEPTPMTGNHNSPLPPPISLTLTLDSLATLPPVGQLSIGSGGRSKFYGPTAAAHVLPDEWEDQDQNDNIGNSNRSINTDTDPDQSQLHPMAFPLLRPSTSAKQTFLKYANNQIPSGENLERWTRCYWKASSWRFEPITKEYFDRILLDIFHNSTGIGSSSGSAIKNGAQLGVLFSILAIGCLFDPDLPPHSSQAQTFDDLAVSCLTAAEFMTNTSLSTLICLHLHCCFLLNDARPRTDEIYVLVGLALRLATMAGFHRDGTWWDLPQGEVDARRRIWWEILTLERVNSNRFGCPSFINFGQFDALRPSDQEPDSFLVWRWEYDNVLHTLINSIESIRSSQNLEALNEADLMIRQYWERVPNQMKPINCKQDDRADEVEVILALQQRRLALHYYTGLLQLHRLGMNRALRLHGTEPLESQFSSSVKLVVEVACKNIIDLVEDIYGTDPINPRHMVVALDLFSTLVPQAALIIRSPRSSLAVTCHHQLVRGVDLLEKATTQTPCPWYEGLLQRGRKLAAKATDSLTMRWGITGKQSNSVLSLSTRQEDGVDNLLGDITQLHKYQHSGVPTPAFAEGDFNVERTLADDLDFERWISSLIEDGPFNYDISGN
ncbi:uncharacterized protein L201_005855 [Kwoniella dendrophila CBS 6074]|uniref:Zn(2)-C6 fungal-type domain-containing protein n=1 Tax=Kwoniella dendrophila CBS 6074 TaxID=1295534 RepID=A0AAX4JZY8_9TREE